jgi:glycosyltransferase involved in cell wall biosynthesis
VSLSILLAGDYPADPTLGSSKVFYKLQEELTALGHRCDIVFADAIGGPQSRQIRQLVAPYYAGRAIARQMRRTTYDVVDAASAEGLFAALRPLRGATGRRAACVCRSNGLEHLNYRRMLDDARAGLTRKPWTRRIWYPLSRLTQVACAARFADRLLLLNQQDSDYALAAGWQPADRIDVVMHGVSARYLDDRPPSPAPRGGGLLFCGSWDHMKGIAYLVRAVEQLHDGGSRPRLTILGPGVPASTVMAAFSEAVRPYVRVVPRAPEDEVIRLYRSHDVLLWTSTYEGFGLVLLEAMSQQLAVVTTPVGCAPALVRDGENGLLVPPRDPGAIAAAVERLMADGGLRQRLGAAAAERVAGMTWRATAERTIEVYERAMRVAGAITDNR